MKKLNLLSKAEMKKVMGGGVGPSPGDPLDSTCSTSCKCPTGYKLKVGMTYSISATCDGNCIAINETSVGCGSTLTTCLSTRDNYCEPISI